MTRQVETNESGRRQIRGTVAARLMDGEKYVFIPSLV
jgi:hypothetical protein